MSRDTNGWNSLSRIKAWLTWLGTVADGYLLYRRFARAYALRRTVPKPQDKGYERAFMPGYAPRLRTEGRFH